MQLLGRVAVVTGGACETGRTIALRLAAEGAILVIADVDAEQGPQAVRTIEAAGGRARFVATDMTDDEAVRRMVGGAAPQVLVNNAGGWGAANYPDATPGQWSATLELNLRAAMLATQLALEPMRAAGGGAVVNIASTAGIGDAAYASPEYGAAKAGLIRFTTALADLRERMGVRVNCVVPDWIATERGRAELARMSPAERAESPDQVPMEEVADAVVDLVRDDRLAGRVVLLRGGEPRRFSNLTPVSDRPVPAVLSIAGSDSGGGAGIQADLKAFARCGVHGMTAIAALTAQNTVAVTGVHPVPGDFIVAQVKAVAEDIGVDAVKIGMLGTADTVRAVREALELLDPATPVVLDPVMVAESGAVLLDEPARAAIVEELLPRVTVITPNVPEARVLAATAGGETADSSHGRNADDVEALARRLRELGPDTVVVTGGHRDEATDLFFDGDRVEPIPGERYADGAAHGSGCTHSSALAAHLALGHTALEAARAARVIAGEAVRDGLRGLGAGAGPVDVFGLTTARRAGVPTRRATTGPLA